MSYLLKANNRKRISGAKLQAKIVEPGKTMASYEEYPITIAVETLSDRECVLRDMQQMDSILSAHNDWDNIQNSVEELSSALGSASNGSDIRLIGFEPSQDNDGPVIDVNDGTILRRPKYSTNAGNNSFQSVMTITISKGEARETYEKTLTIPAYSDDEVLAKIKAVWTPDSFWNIIKGRNVKPERIITDLVNPDVISVLQSFGLYDYFDPQDSNALPDLTITYPTYYERYNQGQSALFTENGTAVNVKQFSASDMWQLRNNSSYSISDVKASDGLINPDEYNLLSINYKSNPLGETVAYKIQDNFVNNDNSITGSFTLGSSTLPCTATIPRVGIVSSSISGSTVSDIVKNSVKISWFFDDLSDYGISDQSINLSNNSVSNPVVLTIPRDKNIVIRLANELRNLVIAPNTITDNVNSPIGYSFDPSSNDMKGFSNAMIRIGTKVGQSMHLIRGTTKPSATVSNSSLAWTEEQCTEVLAAENSSLAYMYLDASEFGDTAISVVMSVTLLDCNIISGNQQTNIYFKIQKVAAS